MSTAIHSADRFTALPDEQELAQTVEALEKRGFGVEIVGDLVAARERVLVRLSGGGSVMTFPSVTLQATGIAEAIDEDERFAAARAKVFALDRATQMREIKAAMSLPDFALGSVHAVTREGVLVIASALGSQLTAYAWGADRVVLVVGAQKLVPDLEAARERIYDHCFDLEDARALEAYGAHSRIGKILEIHEEDPGRIHVVLIREAVGF